MKDREEVKCYTCSQLGGRWEEGRRARTQDVDIKAGRARRCEGEGRREGGRERGREGEEGGREGSPYRANEEESEGEGEEEAR